MVADLRGNRSVKGYTAKEVLRGRTIGFEAVLADLEAIGSALTTVQVRVAFKQLRRHARLVSSAIDAALRRARSEQAALPEEEPGAPTSIGQPSRREALNGRIRDLIDLDEALAPVVTILEGHEGRSASDGVTVLLLGEWGTGKTHFVCDFARAALEDGVPAVAALASMLDGGDPLDELAARLGCANSSAFLDQLETAARAAGRRALIMIDAINEGDRHAWRRSLPILLRAIAKRPDVALVLTCRTPFERQIVNEGQLNRLQRLYHPGFDAQEFDAQLEFFDFHQLPALHVPLLSAEFARPLFLKLLCEGLVRLSARKQKSHLEGIASGQKGMTFVLENFVGSVGSPIEQRHRLQKQACWYLLKGHPGLGHQGLAGRLADLRREWLLQDEVLEEVALQLNLTGDAAVAFVREMVSSGLLVEQLRFQEGEYQEALALPYQRFSDHLVARHLLSTHLDTGSTTRVHRSFYANRRLGAVFQTDRWGSTFAEPGIASALMVEFPERVKRVASPSGPTELISYLPKSRLLLTPVVDAFVEGLYWRDASAFSQDTRNVVRVLFAHDESRVSHRLLEVLLGVAARNKHPWNAEWLWDRLSTMPMAQRDLLWSEFLRLAESTDNPHRLLAWAERPAAQSADASVTKNLLLLLALMTTTTDRVLRDRATRAMVHLAERHPEVLFELVPDALVFNDPYVPERVLAAAYGVAMRTWGLRARPRHFDDSLAALARALLDKMLADDASSVTWHSLTRSYAEGLVELHHVLQPACVSDHERATLARLPLPSESPFRDPTTINGSDVEDGEHAIHMDFGNYTMGRLIENRANYDMEHPEYVDVRKQIADRIGRLGYRTSEFGEIDRRIANYSGRRNDSARTDRYGKKYGWIAYFEMYGIRSRSGLIKDHPRMEPRSTDVDIDPTFPAAVAEWAPSIPDVFASSHTDHPAWLADGRIPDYRGIVCLEKVDGEAGDWVLLEASFRHGAPDGRECHAWVRSSFVPLGSLDVVRAEFTERPPRGRTQALPEAGSDLCTFLGEVPWSRKFGSDIREDDGTPQPLADRAFDYFAGGEWQDGVPVEATTRIWGWDSYHSTLNQVGSVTFPSPALAGFHGLRGVAGSTDLVDRTGRTASIFRRDSDGSRFLYVRKDLVDAYVSANAFQLVTVISGERTLHHDYFDRELREDLRDIFQVNGNQFGYAIGLD